MHIRQMVEEAERTGQPSFSFEYFPPKTAQGVQNLYDRMERMYDLGPKFIDITWGAGGTSADLTSEMVSQAQTYFGLETCMHLTCTDMHVDMINTALAKAYKAGCTNILALRGDPPRDQSTWTAAEGGFRYAKDLVAHIRKTYGNHFDIGVAGYPEGCDDNSDVDELIDHLKEKVDAGGTFVVTQMFYDAENYINWVKKVRAKGITIPIIPGIMPIATYASFLRRAKHMKCIIPKEWMERLEPVKNDDEAVREIGKEVVAEMCRKLLAAGTAHLHFYTMNLAQSTRLLLEELDWMPGTSRRRTLPWKQSLAHGRRTEDVRPIFWANRKKSYIVRTQEWDEFPNGRWGDSRSPAFAALDAYGIGLPGTNEENRKKWGEPKKLRDITSIFIRYLNKELDSLPWSESPLVGETDAIQQELVSLNKRGLLTINSQPAVSGAKSNHPVHGWGPANGYVYQKAYLEVLVPPTLFAEIKKRLDASPDLTYYAVTKSGSLVTNAPGEEPNAVTWGVFPGKEIVQPTVVERISFLAWKDEAFHLGSEWAKCYDANSPSRQLIDNVMNTWYLMNIVNNDFHQPNTIFDTLRDLESSELDVTPGKVANGFH